MKTCSNCAHTRPGVVDVEAIHCHLYGKALGWPKVEPDEGCSEHAVTRLPSTRHQEPLNTQVRLMRPWFNKMADASRGQWAPDDQCDRFAAKLNRLVSRFGADLVVEAMAGQCRSGNGFGTGRKTDGIPYLAGVCRSLAHERSKKPEEVLPTAPELDPWK